MKKLSLLIVFVMLLVAVLALSTSAAFTRGPENDTITAEDVESIELISGSNGKNNPSAVMDGKANYWGGPAGSAVKITFVNEWELSSMSAYLIQNWSGCKISIHAADGTELGAFSEGNQTYNTDYIWGGDARNGKLTDMTNNIKNVSYGDNDPGVKYVVLKCTQDKWGYLTGFAEIYFTGRERIPSEGCENHSFISVEDPAPTCTENGYIIRICELCGAQEEPSVAPALGHAYDSYTVLAPETCLSTPKIQFECTRCGEISTKDNYIQDVTDFANLSTVYIEGSGGWTNGTMFDNDMEKKQQASSGWYVLAELELDKAYYLTGVTIWTGYDSGYSGNWIMTFYYMAPDGTEWLVAGTKQVPPTIYEPHTPSRHELVLEAPVYAKAVKIRVDSITHGNGNVYEAEISGTYVADAYAPGHQLEASEVIAPTCYQHGYTNYVCTVCGEIVKDSYVAFTGKHEYTVEVADTKVDATCTTAGSVKMQCATCTSTTDVEIPATGHSEGAATCTEAYVCTICGETVAEATGHTWFGTECDFCDATRIATIGEASYETFEEALAAAVEGDTIVVLDKVTVEGDVTWDLTGKTIQFPNVVDNYAVVVMGNLTIVGGTFTFAGEYGIGVQKTASLTINDGTFTTVGTYYLIGSWGTTVINGGSYEAYYCVVNCFAGTLSITGGTFVANDDGSGYGPDAVLGEDEGVATITGGTFNTDVTAYLAAGLIQDETGAVVACPHNEYTKVTCTEDSVCTVCGAIVEEAVGHAMSDATCTAPATCEICKYTEGEALGHTPIDEYEGYAYVNATCTEAGYYTDFCSVCEKEFTEVFPIDKENGHQLDWANGEYKDVTCQEDGYDKYTCLLCGETVTYTYEANEDAHVWDESLSVYVESTCKEGGYSYNKCSLCGYEQTEEFDPAEWAHVYDDGVKGDGVIVYTCELCGNTYEEEIVVYPELSLGNTVIEIVANSPEFPWMVESVLYSVSVPGNYALTIDVNDNVYVVNADGSEMIETSPYEFTVTEGNVVTFSFMTSSWSAGEVNVTLTNLDNALLNGTYVSPDGSALFVFADGVLTITDTNPMLPSGFAGEYTYNYNAATGEIANSGNLMLNASAGTIYLFGRMPLNVYVPPIEITLGDNTFNFVCTNYFFGDKKVVFTATEAGTYVFTTSGTGMIIVEGMYGADVYSTYEIELAAGQPVEFIVATSANVMTETEDTVVINAAKKVVHVHVEEAIPAILPTPSTIGYTAGVKCADCGEELVAPVEINVTDMADTKDPNFRIASASLTLMDSIIVNYKAVVTAGYNNPYMVFVFKGEEYIVYSTGVDATNGRLIFDFDKVEAHWMNENIEAYIYAETAEGEYSRNMILEYSVKAYAVNQIKKGDARLTTVISDLLVMGAKTQIYTNYKTNELVTDVVTGEGYTLTPTTFTSVDAKYNIATPVTGDRTTGTDWKSGAVYLGSRTVLQLKFVTNDIDNVVAKITIGNKTVEYTKDDFSQEITSSGELRYVINVDFFSALQYGEDVVGTFEINGEQVGSTITYSVNAYAYRNANMTNANARELVRALYVYGQSVEAYFGK